MLRLRTTSSLSALALTIGIAGTGWLSGLTSAWPGAPVSVAAMSRITTPIPAHRSRQRHRAPPVVVHAQRAEMARTQAASPIVLQPLAMPPDTSESWERLRGHLDGHLMVHLQVAADGRVQQASVASSSGDPILDAHALRSVRGWRFAVPPGHPEGLSGELPMRFSSADRRVGML